MEKPQDWSHHSLGHKKSHSGLKSEQILGVAMDSMCSQPEQPTDHQDGQVTLRQSDVENQDQMSYCKDHNKHLFYFLKVYTILTWFQVTKYNYMQGKSLLLFLVLICLVPVPATEVTISHPCGSIFLRMGKGFLCLLTHQCISVYSLCRILPSPLRCRGSISTMVLTQFPHYVSVPEVAIIYLISLTIILIHSDFRAITDTSAVSRYVCMHTSR